MIQPKKAKKRLNMNSNKANNVWLCAKGIFQDVKNGFDMSKVTDCENSTNWLGYSRRCEACHKFKVSLE